MKLMRILTLVLVFVLVFVPSALAATSTNTDNIVETLESILSESTWDYCNVTYNQKDNLLIVDIGRDGFAKLLITAKQKGWNQYTKDWLEWKDSFSSVYKSTQEILSMFGGDYLKDNLVLRVVNDDVVLRCDYSTTLYGPLLIIRKGVITDDILAQ